VLGAAALGEALFLAGHDAEVLLLDQGLGSRRGRGGPRTSPSSSRAGYRRWSSISEDGSPTGAVASRIAPGCLAALRAKQRSSLISDLQVRTPSGGVHVILPPVAENREVIPLAPEALQTLYRGWQRATRQRPTREAFRVPRDQAAASSWTTALRASE